VSLLHPFLQSFPEQEAQ